MIFMSMITVCKLQTPAVYKLYRGMTRKIHMTNSHQKASMAYTELGQCVECRKFIRLSSLISNSLICDNCLRSSILTETFAALEAHIHMIEKATKNGSSIASVQKSLHALGRDSNPPNPALLSPLQGEWVTTQRLCKQCQS